MATYGGVPMVDFSTLGDLPKVYRQAKLERNRQATLAELGQGADINTVATKLFQAGDVQGGLSLANLANATEQQKFNRGIAERQISLQEKQAEEKPQYMQIDDGQGGKALVQIDPYGRGVKAVSPTGINTTPNNPYLPAGPMNEAQSKDALYANRMLSAEKTFRTVEGAGTSRMNTLLGGVSDKIGYNLRSPDYQKFDQAQRDFINATLRRESGAVISDAEFDNARKQYFPQPGDTADVIKQKRANRAEALRGIAAGAGKGYRPENVMSPEGDIRPNPATTRAAKLPQGYTPDRAIQEAKAAIASGKDRNAVIKRLQEIGVDPAGL